MMPIHCGNKCGTRPETWPAALETRHSKQARETYAVAAHDRELGPPVGPGANVYHWNTPLPHLGPGDTRAMRMTHQNERSVCPATLLEATYYRGKGVHV